MSVAELILINASVLLPGNEDCCASALAIKDGYIAAVGNEEIEAAFRGTKTQVIDCRNKAVIPGFHDAHCHPVGFAESLLSVDTSPDKTCSIVAILREIKRVAALLPQGKWIKAGRYNEFYLEEARHPNRWDLDKATLNHPIKLSHRSGHAHVLNSYALALAGISAETPDPPGGMIERDIETGEPNGILYNMGSYLAKIIPECSDDELDTGMRLANEEFLSLGITSIQDASDRNDIERWRTFQRWKNKRILKSRVTMMLGEKTFEKRDHEGFLPLTEKEGLRIGAIKIVISEVTGDLYPPIEVLKEKILAIHQSGFQVAIHAVEEAEIAAACQSIEWTVNLSPQRGHRHRIEHCSVCTQEMAKRLAAMRAVIVTQPPFVYYSGDRYLHTVSKKNLDHLYPLASLLRSGLVVAGSSDCPVVPPDPLSGIYAAVSRLTTSGAPLLPNERISPLDALKMYTVHAAYSCFTEHVLGTIMPGKCADLVVLSANPAKVSSGELREIRVEMTIVGGEIVWERQGFRQ